MFSMEYRLGASRVNEKGMLRCSGMVDLMQDCSGFQLDTERALNDYFAARGLGMYLASRQIDIRRMPAYGEQLTLKTWIFDCNRFYGCRNTLLLDQSGSLCAASWCIGVFVDLSTARGTRIPQSLLDQVQLEPAYEMPYLSHKLTLPDGSEPWEQLPDRIVDQSMIDRYHHVNNARYFDLGEEALPEGYGYDRVRIAYKIPAKHGERIRPRRLVTEEGCWIALCSEQGKPYAQLLYSQIQDNTLL